MRHSPPAIARLACVAAAWLSLDARAAVLEPSSAPLNVVCSFPAAENPGAGVVLGENGNFYGTASSGGVYGAGAIFEATTNGGFTNLISFNGTNGSTPLAPLLQFDGSFYGTCSTGGAFGKGTVFRVSPAGGLEVLVSFNGANGATPQAPLIEGTNGLLYGTTFNGGTNGLGSIFQISPSGQFSNVVSFGGTNGGENPAAGLITRTDGNLYGTTYFGGVNGLGTIFKLSYAGVLTNVFSFGRTNGLLPGGLCQDRNGNLYGTTFDGGPELNGTIFRFNDSVMTLFSFGITNGASPNSALAVDSAAVLYGTTEQGGAHGIGTIFQISSGGAPGQMLSFNTTNGAFPQGSVIFGPGGYLYGTTSHGGANGAGVVFQAGFPPSIVKQPAGQKWAPGKAATFSVVAGGGSLEYQWLFDGSIIPRQTNATLVVKLENLESAGAYSVIVSNMFGSIASSNAYLSLPTPTVAITPPPSVVSNPSLTISGVAVDSAGIQEVQYELNGAPWTLASGSNRWSAAVVLTPGDNVFQVESLDPLGNVSAVRTARVLYRTLSPVTLATTGGGTIVPEFKGTNLVVGRNYIALAVPQPGEVFSNWTGTVSSNNNVNPLTFQMQSNMVVQANFVANPFTPVTGAYNGLFYPNTGAAVESSGLLSDFIVGKFGGYSGRLLLGATTNGFSGVFDVSGHASHVIARPSAQGGPIVINLTLDWSTNPPVLSGTVSATNGDGWESSLKAERAGPSLAPAQYTLLIPPGASSPASPPGEGYALLASRAGAIVISGGLADGTSFSQVAPVSASGDFPVYCSLYDGAGLLQGWLNLAAGAPAGSLWWIKTPSRPTLRYPNGFTNIVAVAASPWTAQTVSEPSAELLVEGGDLEGPLDFNIAVSNNFLIKLPDTLTNVLTGSINPRNGRITLTFGDGTGRAVLNGTGTWLQSSNFGGGFFLEGASAGLFEITN